MTVIVSVKINDGVVMASDSATTFEIGQTYLHADKIVNLAKGFPIGAMVTGAGGIGASSVSTLLKDFRVLLQNGDSDHPPIALAPYSMEMVTNRLRGFLQTKLEEFGSDIFLKVRICGYSSEHPLAEVWDLSATGRQFDEPLKVQGDDSFGPRWDGEYEPLNRLMLGISDGFPLAIKHTGLETREAEIASAIGGNNRSLFYMNAMPIQDAIDLARWMVEVTAGYIRFNVHSQPKVVAGSIELAAITKHEGFRWVQRRHFYPDSLNP